MSYGSHWGGLPRPIGRPLAPLPVIAAIEGARWLRARETNVIKRQQLNDLLYSAARGNGRAVEQLEGLLRSARDSRTEAKDTSYRSPFEPGPPRYRPAASKPIHSEKLDLQEEQASPPPPPKPITPDKTEDIGEATRKAMDEFVKNNPPLPMLLTRQQTNSLSRGFATHENTPQKGRVRSFVGGFLDPFGLFRRGKST